MDYPINTDDRFAEMHEDRDREISLGTSTILGIFFALALICSVFFGFGYTLGRRSAQVVATGSESTTMPASHGAKPAPGSPANPSGPASTLSRPAESEPDLEPEQIVGSAQRTPRAVPVRSLAPAVSLPSAVASSDQHTLTKHAVPAPAAVSPAPTASSGPAAPTIVQVTALTRQDDADNLVAALKRRGYDVLIHHEPQDKLLHVQIGPLTSKKEAELMRDRLLADGYHAILKDPPAASAQATPKQ